MRVADERVYASCTQIFVFSLINLNFKIKPVGSDTAECVYALIRVADVLAAFGSLSTQTQ